MAVVTNHTNLEVDIAIGDVPSPRIEVDTAKLELVVNKISDVIDSLSDSSKPKPFNYDDLVGKSTIKDGGTIGRLLDLLHIHLVSAKDSGVLTSDDFGKVYAEAIKSALNAGVDIESRRFDSELKNSAAIADVASSLVDLQTKLTNTDIVKQEYKKLWIDNNIISPLNREKLKESIFTEHFNHLKSEYEYNNFMVLEKDRLIKTNTLLDDDHGLKAKSLEINELERLIKDYYKNNMQPSEKIELDRKNSLLSEQISLTNMEYLIKSYYKTYIQPEEKTITEAKAFQEEVNAGGVNGNYVKDESLPYVRIEQLKVQTDLYTRQIGTYDDARYQKLLDTMMNYRSMVYADQAAPTLVTFASTEQNFTDIYDKLK